MLFKEKTSICFAVELYSLREIAYVVLSARADDAKIVRGRDAINICYLPAKLVIFNTEIKKPKLCITL